MHHRRFNVASAHARRARSVCRVLIVAGIVPLALLIALPATGDGPRKTGTADRMSFVATPRPDLSSGPDGPRIDLTTAAVSKAKVQFRLPSIYLRGQLNTCFAGADSDGTSLNADPSLDRLCRDLLGLPLPSAYQNPSHGLVAGSFDGYVATRSGSRLNYGTFPPVTVQALAFGAIPVSATVQLVQAAAGRYISPLHAEYTVVVGLTDEGALAYPGFGVVPAPLPVAGGSAAHDLTVLNNIDGKLDVQISNVKVDGRPVDVGPLCTTDRPATLKVREPLGYDVFQKQYQFTRGLPGGFRPAQGIQPPGYFDGTADIPAFTHCGTSNQNLDKLLTNLISSSHNLVSGFLPESITLTQWCETPLSTEACELSAAQNRMRSLSNAINAHKSLSVLRKLQAEMKPSDYVMPKVKAPKNYGK